MKKSLFLAAAILVYATGHAQKRGYTVVNRTLQEDGRVIHMDERDGDGIAWIQGEAFTVGTIEFEVRGKDVLQRSFVGFAFHGVNDSTFEAVYFRPFNFRNADVARRPHAVQYVALPGYDWQRLRTEHPGVYEQPVSPAPDPNGWFHVRIDVRADKISVYINGNGRPSLVVAPLVRTGGRQIGYWVGNGSGGDWRNLTIGR